MSVRAVRMFVSVLLSCVIACQGLELTIDRTPGSQFCAQLRCEQTVSQTDQRISYIIGLSIYNLTFDNSRVRLASLSLFDPVLHVDHSKIEVINGTGSITRNLGWLTLSFQDLADCVEGSFLCELDFVNVSGQPDKITESTRRQNSSSSTLLEEQLRSLAARVNNLTSHTQTALSALVQRNTILKGKVTELTQNDTVLEGKVTQLTQENDDREGKVTELTQNDTVLQSKVTLLTDENLELRSSLDHVAQRLDLITSKDPQVTCDRNKTIPQFMLWGYKPVLCDTQSDGGGWIIIQRRTTGDVDFNRGWADYKNGFGTIDNDYWLGLDIIHSLTSQGFNELRVDLNFFEDKPTWYVQYSSFSIADESMNYRLSVSGDSGTLGNGLQFQNNKYFSTYDRDNDGPSDNCARTTQGAWWFPDFGCSYTNLNARWGLVSGGVEWESIGSSSPASLTEMKVRRPLKQ